MSENTLKRARNELKQLGLIDFIPAVRKGDITKYKIALLVSKYMVKTDSRPDTRTDPRVDTNSDTRPADIYKINKTKLNKEKINKKEGAICGVDKKDVAANGGTYKGIDLTGNRANPV